MIASSGRESRPKPRMSALRAGVLAAVAWSALAVLSAAPKVALTSDDFFDQSALHDIRLIMKEADWAALQAAYLEDTYYRADMQWRDQTVPIVGVRSRGSGSRNPLPAFVKCLAVDNFLADFDGYLGFWGPNNFYVYRQQGRKDLVFFPWDKDLAFWAPDYDIQQGVANNVLARRALDVPSLYRTYMETLVACARSAMAPVSADNATGWLEAEALKEIAQFHDAGLADAQKWFTNERMDDEQQKVLQFARARGPYVLREAQKSLDRLQGVWRRP